MLIFSRMMKTRKLYGIVSVLLVCLLASPTVCAQSSNPIAELDSLLKCYEKSNGTSRKKLGQQVLDFCTQQTVFFGPAPTIDGQLSVHQQDLRIWFAAERYLTTTSYYKEALTYIGYALANLQKEAQSDIHCTLLCDQAYCLFKTSDYTRAVEAGQEAMRLCQKTGNMLQLSRAYLYIAIVNHAMAKFDEAKALAVKAIEINEKLPNNVQLHNALGVACEIFCSAREVDQAIVYGQRAVEEARKIGFLPGVANHLTQLSYAYDRKGDYAKGLQASDSAIAIIKDQVTLDRNQLALTLEYKSWNLIDIGRPAEAAEALREVIRLNEEIGNANAVCNAHRTLAEALEPIDTKEALDVMKRYIHMSDTIHAQQLKELMSQANAEFHNAELQEANAQSRRMNTILFVSSIIIVLMLAAIIASLLFAFRQKKQRAEALQKLTKIRESFFTNVTHEFRTPLTVILGLGKEIASMTPEQLQPEEVSAMGKTIERQGTRMLTLVNQLLDISKIKSAIGIQEQTEGDIATEVGMIVEAQREMGRQKGVSVHYETDREGIMARYSSDYLKKVVSNLLSNAIKFTPEGGRVDIRVHAISQQLVMSVADTGCGIAESDLPHIFEPFYQTTESGGQGSGVGLALVHQIVETLGGRIEVKSQQDKGTTFTIHLPLHAASSDIASPSPETMPAIDISPADTSGSSILIVEDNKDVAHLIGHQLGGNYDIHYAADGEEGIRQAQAIIPDLIITDLMMPKVDGLELCRTLRHEPATSHIPIIAITAKTSEADRVRGLQEGVDAYLCKPYNAKELHVRVEKLLEMRELLRRKYNVVTVIAASAATSATTQNEVKETQPAALAEAEAQQDEAQSFALYSEDFIQKVHEAIIRTMPQRNCTVETIAQELCITSSQLRRKMNSITGIAPKKYIMKVRLEYARDLLHRNQGIKLVEIADQCGFSDLPHFIRLYKEAYGITPAADNRKK